MKRVSALLLTCTLGLSALSGCSASAAPQPLSAQPVTISEEEMMRHRSSVRLRRICTGVVQG